MGFSVVIPLFNKEDYIDRAIESALNQTYKEFEIIIVDDGSTDSSIVKVNKYIDSRIRLVQLPNSGVSAARNKGISLANYKYIGFLDADDAWKPNFLETINSLIEKYPNAGAYATAYEYIDVSSKVVLPKSILGIEKGWQGIVDDYFKCSLESPLISASSVVIPKNVFEHVGGFPVGIKRGEDLDLWSRIALKYDIAFSNKVSATYFQNTINSATKRKAVLSESFVSYAEERLIKGRQEEKYSTYFEEYMISRLMSKVRYLITSGRNKEARQLLWKYKYTKYNKKKWFKNYILSFKPVYALYQNIK